MINRSSRPTTSARSRNGTAALVAVVAAAAIIVQGLSPVQEAAAAPSIITVTTANTTARDDGTVPFTRSTGWNASAVTGPDGAASLYSGTQGATAVWRPDVLEAGAYVVQVGIPDSANTTTAETYTVTIGADGHTVVLNPSASRGQWADLGEWAFPVGTSSTVSITSAATPGLNTRVSSMRIVPVGGAGEPEEPGETTTLPFFEDYENGMAGWTAMSGQLDSWKLTTDVVTYTTVNTLAQSSGYYVRPTAALTLPSAYELNTTIRIDEIAGNGSVSILTDMLAPYSYVADNLATQFRAPGATGNGTVTIAKPNSKLTVCSGASPNRGGDWFNLTIRRADGITAVWVNSELVSAVASPTAGGTIALGSYHSKIAIGAVSIVELGEVPADHPTAAEGCTWAPAGEPSTEQPVIANQSGFNLGDTKRFTAPLAEDGAGFAITDASGVDRFTGTVSANIGDFSAFDPADAGPFVITVTGAAGVGTSYPFGIGTDWIERVSYERAVQFMTDARCYYGDLSKTAFGSNPTDCLAGIGWRDSHQISFELPAMVDLYLSNPSVFQSITDESAPYAGTRYTLPTDTPELVRLISWATELYLKGAVNHTLMKEQLASFLYAYPALAEYIPVGLYNEARDYLFPIWGDTAKNRYAWHDTTPHTADLFQTYTQIGTGKGELPVGHSIVPNLEMWQVAVREGRADAEDYKNSAVEQAAWIIENVDVADPTVTKGQRQGESHLMTSLARLDAALPAADVPAGLDEFVSEWVDVAISRSDNLWDFRMYSDDRWTIPFFSNGGAGEDPNEAGNVLGFSAAALAAVQIIGEGERSDRLREIAVAHIDDVFGRNPVSRAASYRGATADFGFEGIDRGWFSEYQGGNGKLQGSRGVFDGTPKNGHYPFNSTLGNIGHTEGWVTYNTAWLETLAWRAFDSTTVTFAEAVATPDAELSVVLSAPLNMNVAGGNTAEVLVSVDGREAIPVTVTQTAVNGSSYSAAIDLAELGAEVGDTVIASYGYADFERSDTLEVVEEAPPTVDPTVPPTTTVKTLDPSQFDPALRLPVDAVVVGSDRGTRTVSITLNPSYSGQWVYAVFHSTATPAGWFRVGASGVVTVTVPAGLAGGSHTVALYDANGTLNAFGAAPDLAALAETGGSPWPNVVFAAALITLGLLVRILLRARSRSR